MSNNGNVETKAEWAWRSVVIVLLGILGWFLRDMNVQQQQFNRSVESRVLAVELDSAKTSGNLFTSNDWIQAKSSIDQSIVGLDKRVTRNEDAVLSTSVAVKEINQKLDQIRTSVSKLQ